MNKHKKYSFYKEHPKKCDPDDFWGQVMRSVNGKPVDEIQIRWIVEAVVSGLQLNKDDVLLDLCCGNGALSDRLFSHCQGGLGVDFSEVLIEIARKNFERSPSRIYHLEDVETFVNKAADVQLYSKAVCYGSFMYLPSVKARNLLELVNQRFPNIKIFFIGNLPDKAKMNGFFFDKVHKPGIENDPDSPIGIWRTQKEFKALVHQCGWHVNFSQMREDFYAAKYRYDAILTRVSK